MLRYDSANDPFPNPRHEIVLDAEKGITMGFRWIPAGRFRMGSRGMGLIDHGYGFRPGGNEEPVHEVEITKGYWIAETPVTQAQFAVWKPDHENGFPNHPQHPAESLDWHEASEFCEWMATTALNRPIDFEKAGLPTEAQWERACRGPDDPEKGHLGHHCEFYNGDGEAALAKVGWYEGNAGGTTHEVGLLDPNGWGLHDLHGNVREWCRDLWHESPYVVREEGCRDPVVTEETPGSDGTGRVLRGGSWIGAPRGCRSAFRGWWGPTGRFRLLGFRPVLLLSALPGSGGAVPTEPG